jgi:hypothetical protein
VTGAAADARLEALVRSSDWLMGVLRAARDVAAPDWLVGGGVLRDLVWDRLHGRAAPSRPRDVDLAFFDPPASPRPARDRRPLVPPAGAPVRRQGSSSPGCHGRRRGHQAGTARW